MSVQLRTMLKFLPFALFLAGCGGGGGKTYVEEGYYEGPYFYRGNGHERHEYRQHGGGHEGGHHGGGHEGGHGGGHGGGHYHLDETES